MSFSIKRIARSSAIVLSLRANKHSTPSLGPFPTYHARYIPNTLTSAKNPYQCHSPAHSQYARRPFSSCKHPPEALPGDEGEMADATSRASTTSSGKRKRNTPLTFYAVKVGRAPGVYQTWDEAKQQIEGFPNPEFKKFGSYTEAEAMVKGTSSSSFTTKPGKTKYYGVAVGHVPGVYTDYTTVQAQTKGCIGARQKGFATHAEAQAYVDGFRRQASAPISPRGDLSEYSSLAPAKSANIGENVHKKQKKEQATPAPALTNGDVKYEPGWGPLPPDSEDGFDRTIKLDPASGNIRMKTEEELGATKSQPTGDFSGPIVVYTDGSSLGNGRVGAVGGVGVFFGRNDPRNVSEPLRGKRQTNQRAELTAVARALDHIAIDREALIITDSNYSIKCLTEWFPTWEKKGWKNSAGKDVENKDLIEPIIARIRERDMCRAKTKFQWIKGHANDPGNVAADALAVQGSRYSTPELRNAREFSETLNILTRSPSEPTRTRPIVEAKVATKKEAEIGPGPASEPAPAPIDDDDAFDEIFANLAAEQSVNHVTDAALAQNTAPPLIADEARPKPDMKAGHEHVEQNLNEEPPNVQANALEKMDVEHDAIERV
ncbi:Nn.00g079290.m01.CDS01 [Neocucurbitaria sp. VM-36]